MLNKIALIAVAGATGTLARYAMSGAVHRFLGSDFPWGTFCVNILGCFIAGLVWSVSERSMLVSSSSRTIFFIGFLGAFTTFSSFILETNSLIKDAELLWAAKNILLNNGVGFAALLLGNMIGGML